MCLTAVWNGLKSLTNISTWAAPTFLSFKTFLPLFPLYTSEYLCIVSYSEGRRSLLQLTVTALLYAVDCWVLKSEKGIRDRNEVTLWTVLSMEGGRSKGAVFFTSLSSCQAHKDYIPEAHTVHWTTQKEDLCQYYWHYGLTVAFVVLINLFKIMIGWNKIMLLFQFLFILSFHLLCYLLD